MEWRRHSDRCNVHIYRADGDNIPITCWDVSAWAMAKIIVEETERKVPQ